MQKGDIVYLDFDAWITNTNELFDTTNEKLAREKNIYDSKIQYRPMPILVGHERVLKGLDKSLLTAELDREYDVDVPPSEGAGDRDPQLVEIHSMNEILRLPEFRRKDAKPPEVGMQLLMGGKLGTIARIGAGRVTIDFNNRLAGKTLKYRYRITKKTESPEDKVRAFVEMHYGQSDKFSVEAKGEEIRIQVADSCKHDPKWILPKLRIVTDLREFMDAKKVVFIEEHIKKEEKKEEEKMEQPAAPSEKKEGADVGEKESAGKKTAEAVETSPRPEKK